jgi:hypothetical protein
LCTRTVDDDVIGASPDAGLPKAKLAITLRVGPELWCPPPLACKRTRDRCYDFLNIFAKKFTKKWRF